MRSKIGKSAKLLIASDLIYTLTAVFIETFLVAYFLKITNESITTIAIYYIIIYALMGVGNILIGSVIKKHLFKNKQILSVGIVIRALFILLIVIMSEKIASNFILIAVIYAISEIFYWCAHELIYIDVTNNQNRKNYFSVKKILSKLVNVVTPIILGTSIELYSFTKIAIYVFLLSVIQIVITLMIKPSEVEDKSVLKKYSLKEFSKHVKENKLNKVTRYSLSGIFYGIVESTISTLIVIMTVMTFVTSFNLGVLTTIFAFCSIVALLIYNRVYNPKHAKYILSTCSVIIIIGVLGLLFDINKVTLVIYNFCYTITFCIFDVLYNTRKGDLVKECKLENYREEYIGYTAISITVGRIIGYSLMLLVSFTTNIVFMKILLAGVTAFAPLYCYLIYKSEKN